MLAKSFKDVCDVRKFEPSSSSKAGHMGTVRADVEMPDGSLRHKSGLRARPSGHVLESRSIEAELRLAMREREELEVQTGLTRR